MNYTADEANEILDRAETAADKGNVEQAILITMPLVEAFPDHPLIFAILSGYFCDLRKYPEALALAEKAVELDGEYPRSLSALTRALHHAERFEESVAPARKLIEFEPEKPHSFLTLAASLYELERAEEALEICERGLLLDSGYPPLLHFQALSYALLGDREAALRVVDRVLEESPSDAHGYAAAGWVHYWIKDDVAAKAHFERALALDPFLPWGFEGLGLTLGRLGRHEEAKDALRQAIVLAPGTRRAASALAQLQAGPTQH